jgi:hypothetical protein
MNLNAIFSKGFKRDRSLTIALAAAAVFSSGFALGQRATTSSKFAKYEKQAFVSVMDWDLTKAQIMVIQQTVPGQIAPPTYRFDSETRKIKARMVMSRSLGSEAMDSLKNKLLFAANRAVAPVQAYVPEAADQDIEAEFVSWDQGGRFYTFADYANGQLTFSSR